MGKYSKLRDKILAGGADTNIELSSLFTRGDVFEIINLQPRGKKAKPYQVKQVRSILVKHRLGDADVD